MRMKLPNFLIIGAAKSGTTSLYHYLDQHPAVYMSPMKETNYFAYAGQAKLSFPGDGPPPKTLLESITDAETYAAQFAGVRGETAVGEASVLYLYHPDAPGRIHAYNPQMKLIAVLRHPADRAYSHFMHLIRDEREPVTDFAKALALEPERRAQGWSWDYYYRDMGFYGAQLQRYLDLFTREQMRIFLYEDLLSDPLGLLRELFTFLEVDPSFQPDVSFRHNVSGVPQNESLHNLMQKPNLFKSLVRPLLPTRLRRRLVTRIRSQVLAKPDMPADARADLIAGYRDDILHLGALVNRDLSAWLA